MAIHIQQSGPNSAVASSAIASPLTTALTFGAGLLVSVLSGLTTVLATYFTWILAASTIAWVWPETWAQFFGWLPNAHGNPRAIGFAMASLRVFITALK